MASAAAGVPAGPPRNMFQGLLPIDRARVPMEVVAGVTLAALAIPEVMGYTKIAGTPVVTGLYTIVVPMLLFALFGSSRHLVVGADSATAAILAAGLAGMAASGSAQYVALASLLALMAAGFLILARVLNLGFLADFMSRTVLVGFLTGVGIQVAVGQFASMLGVPGGGGGPVQDVIDAVKELPMTDVATLAVSGGVLLVVLGSKRINPRIPGALIAVIGSILLSYALDLSASGVAVLGPVPGGLPQFGLPAVQLSDVVPLISTAVSIFVVILAQSAATSRAYAARYSERFSENVDLVGLSLANLGAGLTGTFVVNGSPTKTQMVDSAGGRSQLAQVITTGIVVAVLLFLTKPLAYMPSCVLATVVFLIGVELVDVKGMRRIMEQRRDEFWVALLTAATVVFVGVEPAILLAMFLSLLQHVSRGYKPHNFVLVPSPEGGWHQRATTAPEQAAPGLLIYRFQASMYYANAEGFTGEVLALVEAAAPPLAWFCLDASAVPDVDYSAGATLREIARMLGDRNVRFCVAGATEDVRAELDVLGVTEMIGADALYASAADVLAAYRARAATHDAPDTAGS